MLIFVVYADGSSRAISRAMSIVASVQDNDGKELGTVRAYRISVYLAGLF